MSKFSINIVSKDSNFKINEEDIDSYMKEHSEHVLKANLIANNKEHIGVIYNKIFGDYINTPDDEKADFVVLMHADVFFDLSHFLNHVEECKEKYDVFGLCGTEVLNISKTPLNWYTGSSDCPDKRWGCVMHGELGNTVSFFSGDRKETTDHSVGCIDGLCMVFNRKAVESGLRFNEEFEFNCYDTQISLDALMNKKLQIGVIVEPSLQHYSVGRSILTKEFKVDEILMRRHFGFPLPQLPDSISS